MTKSDLKREIEIQQAVINILKNKPKIDDNYVKGMQNVLDSFKTFLNEKT